MDNQKNIVSRHLSLKFLILALTASIFAFTCNYFIGSWIPLHIFTAEKYREQWNQVANQELIEFQTYVTKHHLTKQEVLQDYWQINGSNVSFFFEEIPFVNHQDVKWEEYVKEQQIFVLECSDGMLYSTTYSAGYDYLIRWEIYGMISGTLCAILIISIYVFRLLHRIKKLHKQILCAKTNRACSITTQGSDELSDLTTVIEEMRLVLWKIIDQEKESQKQQTNLISSLSHDIRSPLTKLTSYLDIARQDTKNYMQYLNKAYEKTQQIKALSDKLLNCVLVNGELIYDDRQILNGPEFLSQVFYEGTYDMETSGFTVQLPEISGNYYLNISIEAFQRICNNIASNIVKYGDSNIPVSVDIQEKENHVLITISNQKSKTTAHLPKHNIGLPTITKLMEQMGGKAEFLETEILFTVQLTIPILSVLPHNNTKNEKI